MQRMAADHLLKSQEINAPVTILGEAEADGLVEFYDELASNPSDPQGPKISLTHILIALIAAALRRHPKLNAGRDGQTLEVYADINIGMALALSDGYQ
jgi:pyruvate/2-oxoglutarate dehydrogenase complex dihydrolipoamide acyltransferase (E2) component